MSAGDYQALVGRVTRLKVFSAMKAFMVENERSPTATQIAQITGLSHDCCAQHMRALAHADGLPLPVVLCTGVRGVAPDPAFLPIDTTIADNQTLVWR